jgi:hypothetical protein
VLSASQAASGNYEGATATISFTVAAAPVAPAGFTLTTSAGSGVETVLPGEAAAYNLMLAPGVGVTYLDAALTFSRLVCLRARPRPSRRPLFRRPPGQRRSS